MVWGDGGLSISVGMSKLARRWKVWVRCSETELHNTFLVLKYPRLTPIAGDLPYCTADKSQGSLVFQSAGAIVFVV